MLCEHPDILRQELRSSWETLQVGDDMTRPFDTLGGEACVVTVPILMAVHAAVGEVSNPPPSQPGGVPSVCSASTVLDRDGLGRRVDTYRRWSRVFRQLAGDGWSDDDFIGIWDAVVGDLAQRMWLSKVVNRTRLAASMGMEALHCVYDYMTLLMMSVAVRRDDLVHQATGRLERLWKRVRHFLETVEDNPSLAASTPS